MYKACDREISQEGGEAGSHEGINFLFLPFFSHIMKVEMNSNGKTDK